MSGELLQYVVSLWFPHRQKSICQVVSLMFPRKARTRWSVFSDSVGRRAAHTVEAVLIVNERFKATRKVRVLDFTRMWKVLAPLMLRGCNMEMFFFFFLQKNKTIGV